MQHQPLIYGPNQAMQPTAPGVMFTMSMRGQRASIGRSNRLPGLIGRSSRWLKDAADGGKPSAFFAARARGGKQIFYPAEGESNNRYLFQTGTPTCFNSRRTFENFGLFDQPLRQHPVKIATTEPNRILSPSFNSASSSVIGTPLTCVPFVECKSFSR